MFERIENYFRSLGLGRIFVVLLFLACACILELQSALQTAEWCSGQTTDAFWSKALAVGGAALDYGQIGFPIAAVVAWHTRRYVFSILFWIVAILVAFFSLYTSIVCNVNWNNETINATHIEAQKNVIYQNSSKTFDVENATASQLLDQWKTKTASRKSDEKAIKDEYVPKIAAAKKKAISPTIIMV